MRIEIDNERAALDAERSKSGRSALVEIEMNGTPVRFSLREALLLKHLSELGEGEVSSRVELLKLIWPETSNGNPNRLDQVLWNIRRKSPLLVVNDGRGWRLNKFARVSLGSSSA